MIVVSHRVCGKNKRDCGVRSIIESTTCHDHDGDNVKLKERQAAVKGVGA